MVGKEGDEDGLIVIKAILTVNRFICNGRII